MPSRKELRRMSGIDVRTEDEIRKARFLSIKDLVTSQATQRKLYCTVEVTDPVLMDMIRDEYPDSSVTLSGNKLTINWAEAKDVAAFKRKIKELRDVVLSKVERVNKIREWENQMVMNGGLAMMGRNDEKYGLESDILKLRAKIRELETAFIEE